MVFTAYIQENPTSGPSLGVIRIQASHTGCGASMYFASVLFRTLQLVIHHVCKNWIPGTNVEDTAHMSRQEAKPEAEG